MFGAFSLDAGLGWLQSELGKFFAVDPRAPSFGACDPETGPASASCINLDGQRADLCAGLHLQHRHAVRVRRRAATIEFTPRINYGHVSEQWATLFQNEARGDRVEARNILNAQLAWRHGKFVTTLYGTNLTDQHYVGADQFGPALRGSAAAVRPARSQSVLTCTPKSLPFRQCTHRCARLVGAGDSVLRLRAQLPRPAAAVDPGQADPGRARRHRRPAGPDQRALFRAVLLRARDPGRAGSRIGPTGCACCRFACALWSAATVACGMAANYPQLAAARMAVGVGEAGGVPPSYAIISDYFPPGTRGTALGLFNLGPPIGQALGVAFGASIAAAYGWRAAFVVARRGRHRHGADRAAVRARAGARRPRRAARRAAPAQRPREPLLADLPHVLRGSRAVARVAGHAARRSSSPTRCSTSPRCS